ncbi:unnamed protein product [Amoebophrya sp. A120]|nr:unnamed protein product [Amoebophrya sp. A120]|eukprot:GSA120T00009764001.1
MSAAAENVQVVVRLRPDEENYADGYDPSIYHFEIDKPHVLTIRDPLSKGRSDHTFVYSKILLPDDKQEKTFTEIAKPLVNHTMLGFNSCCFAYGQTGSGKTYSIFGEGNNEARGILPRAVEYLFERIEENSGRKEIGMVCSFLEVYLDQIRDLGRAYLADRHKQGKDIVEGGGGSSSSTANAGFGGGSIRTGGASRRPTSASSTRGTTVQRANSNSRPSSAHGAGGGGTIPDPFGIANIGNNPGALLQNWHQQDLEIHETPEGQVFVKDLTLVPVRTIQEVIDVVNLGLQLRETHGTSMNAVSSRSHTVFTINVVQKERRAADSDVISGMINLVDLAGSERIARSKSEGSRFQEAVMINSSLSALGRVVLALSTDPKEAKFIPYRDSKLTRILQGSLGGNSFTTLLACVHPGADNYEESVNTLMFADRCRYMENKPVVNYLSDPAGKSNDRKVKRLLAEIADLKSQLDISKATNEQRAAFVNEQLGTGGMPDYLKGLASEADATKKAKQDLENAQRLAAQKLAEEKAKAEAAEKKAQEALNAFGNARKEMQERDEKRRREMLEMRDKMLAMEKELDQQKKNYEKLIAETAAQNKEELEHWKDQVKKLINTKDDLIMRVPDLLKDSALLLETKQQTWKDQNKALHDRHKHQLHALKDSHESEATSIVKQYKYFLQEKENETEELVKSFNEYYEKKKREQAEYEEEMLALYELIQQLSRICHDMETGQYPVCYRLGLRCVQVPPGVKPTLPSKVQKGVGGNNKFEKLFSAIAETKRKADKYEKMMNLRGLQEPADASKLTNEPTTAANQPDHSTSMESPSNNDILSNWDPRKFTSDFCRSAEEDNVDVLRVLNIDQLKALCVCLKNRANTEFDIQAEKQVVRDEVMRDLSSHPTVEYLRFLETEVDSYKQKLADETLKTRNLKVALSSSHISRDVPLGN